MSHRYLLIFLGLLLIAMGLWEGGWFLAALWLGGDFLVLGIAHTRGAHRIFGKRSDGSLPLWSWLLFLPLLVYTSLVWHIARLLSREPDKNVVTDELVVGRRLLPGELCGEFANYVDLTAEFPEPVAIRRASGYLSFPILDGSAPDPSALAEFVSRLRPGKTFIHCAQGHGRTGLVALAVLLQWRVVRSEAEGLEILKSARPGISLTAIQHKCIQEFARYIETRGAIK